MSEQNQGRTEMGPFSIIPEWVIDADISANAKLLYAVMARYADKDDKTAYPSRQTLANRLRISKTTVDRLIKELEDISAISVERRKLPTNDGKALNQTNLYTVRQVAPFTGLPPRGGNVSEATSNVSEATWNADVATGSNVSEAHNYNHLELEPIELENTCSNEFFPAVTSEEIAIIDNDKETVASMFEEFWEAYSFKQDKQKAIGQWKKQIKDLAMAEMVIAKAKEYKAARDPAYVKLASGWLLNKRWEDEIVHRAAKKSKSSDTINYLKELAQAEGLFND